VRSERLIKIEVGQIPLGQELIAPGLLDLRAVRGHRSTKRGLAAE
jgi:hypothetical protein